MATDVILPLPGDFFPASWKQALLWLNPNWQLSTMQLSCLLIPHPGGPGWRIRQKKRKVKLMS